MAAPSLGHLFALAPLPSSPWLRRDKPLSPASGFPVSLRCRVLESVESQRRGDDFNDLNDFNGFNDLPLTAYCAKRPELVEGLTAYHLPFDDLTNRQFDALTNPLWY